MKRNHGTKRTRRRGFTLTEMLIVLGILVALAALVVPRFLGTQKKTDIQRTQAQIGAFRGALEKYYLDNRGFPTTEQGLAALLTQQRAGANEPVVFLLHCAAPRVRYTDRGKSAIAME